MPVYLIMQAAKTNVCTHVAVQTEDWAEEEAENDVGDDCKDIFAQNLSSCQQLLEKKRYLSITMYVCNTYIRTCTCTLKSQREDKNTETEVQVAVLKVNALCTYVHMYVCTYTYTLYLHICT